jgi:hypothetical protein
MWPRRRIEVREVDHLMPGVIPRVLLQLTGAQASQSNQKRVPALTGRSGPTRSLVLRAPIGLVDFSRTRH